MTHEQLISARMLPGRFGLNLIARLVACFSVRSFPRPLTTIVCSSPLISSSLFLYLPFIMKIGIIGAGMIGGVLTRHLAKLGHKVAVANSRGPESLKDLIASAGNNATAVTASEAVKDKDLIILTIPQINVPKLPKDLFANVPASTIVIDTGNYYPIFRDGNIAELDKAGVIESAWVAQHIGHPVLKVFNNISFYSLDEGGLPHGNAGRIALPVAGDDASHKQTVIALLNELGFDGVDAGSLNESWRQQPGTPVYCTDYDIANVRRALAAADNARALKKHEEMQEKMKQMKSFPPRNEFIQMQREHNDPKAA